MTRPTRNRLLAVVLVVVTVVVLRRLPDEATWLVGGAGGAVMALALWVTAPFRKARGLMREKKFDEAATELAAFELSLADGWRKWLAGLAVGLYTTNAIAASRNTLGAVRLEQGRLEDATTHFDAAIALDPLYAMPWANRAVLAAMKGDRAAAMEAKDKARTLGFGSKTLDAVLHDKLTARSS